MSVDILPINYPAAGYMTYRDESLVSDIIIHHTAGAMSQTPLEIDAEHRAIGDSMIAYNRIITPDGKIYMGRPDHFVPAAAFGRNTQSLNIVLVGNFQSNDAGYTGPPTDAQMESLKQLVLQLHKQYPHVVRTIGHSDVARLFYPSNEGDYSTECPGTELYGQLGAVRSYVSKSLASL